MPAWAVVGLQTILGGIMEFIFAVVVGFVGGLVVSAGWLKATKSAPADSVRAKVRAMIVG